ncbi:hypothetical protein [Leifsonia sp. C5G2]|uniref:hypothetical protein n=1 Tax=Leifsonia sp. C5G2 TaxID=2735269 RepID=UPI0015859018|nr:hypothetical protein [Leifsonia sp. C5G2]NUU05495.1 hypothetical protein [Leifsonia sp. C5G2]
MRGTPGEQAGEARALADEVGSTSLAALLDAAVDRAEEAELLLTRYEDGAPLVAVDARRSLRLRVAFAELQRWVDELDLAGRDAEVRDETSRLLAFYLHLLTHAFERGIRPEHDRFAIRGRGPLTGAPAARLATLRERVRAA